jgi:hypothetical protein
MLSGRIICSSSYLIYSGSLIKLMPISQLASAYAASMCATVTLIKAKIHALAQPTWVAKPQ